MVPPYTLGMKHRFEDIKTRLFSSGHTDVRPTSIKTKTYKGKKKSSVQIRYKISYINVETNKRESTGITTETYPLEDSKGVEKRLKILQSYQLNLDEFLDDVHTKKIDKNINHHLIDFLENRLQEKISSSLQSRMTKEEASKSVRCCEDRSATKSFLEFLEKKNISTFTELDRNENLLRTYPSFLLQLNPSKHSNEKFNPIFKKVYGRTFPDYHTNHKTKREKPIAFYTVNKRIKFVRAFAKHLRGKYGDRFCREYNELRPLSTAERESISVGRDLYFKERRSLTEKEILKVYQKISPSWMIPFIFLLLTGIRKGKGMMLLNEEVDLKNKVINLKGSKVVRFGGKTYHSRRKNKKDLSIPISDELCKVLRLHEKWKKKNGVPKESPFYFPTVLSRTPSQNGHPRTNNFLREFRRCLASVFPENNFEEQSLDIHSLRKTASVRMIEESLEFNLLASKELLGHSDEEITRKHYSAKSEVMIEQIRGLLNQNPIGFNLLLIGKRLGL